MALLPVRIYGDPILRRESKPIEEVDDEILSLALDMLETMRHEEGIGRTINVPVPWSYDCVLVAPVYLKRAETYEQSGQTAKAAENYAKFVERWQDCDEELLPRVAEARSRLDALTAADRQ